MLYGYNLGSRSLVFWDRFACDNYNSVILGRSGAGKSYLVKLELLRSLYRGVEAHVIDPEDEYTRLAHAVGGAVITPGAPGVHVNPFDLPITVRGGRHTARRDALTRRALFLHTFLTVLLGEPLTAIDRAVLDTAITATYTAAGITDDPATWARPAPLLADLRATLTATADRRRAHRRRPRRDGPRPRRHGNSVAGTTGTVATTAARLAALLHPFTDGAFAGLFARPTSTSPDSHLVVWSLRELPEPLRPVGTLLALDAIWTRVTDPADRRPRLVVVDEAWLLLQQPAGAQFLLRAAKSGRKHWAGLTVATQDTADVLGTDLGRAVVTNAATQILLRQAPQAIDAVVDTFGLSEGERAFLLSADRGHALLSAGAHRVGFQAVAADAEHDLITTDPAELAARDNDHVDAAAQRQRRSPTSRPVRDAARTVAEVRPGGCGAGMTPPTLPDRACRSRRRQAVSAIAACLAEHARLVIGPQRRPVPTARGGRRAWPPRAAAAGLVARIALRRARHRRLLVGARLVTVLAPPHVTRRGRRRCGATWPGWPGRRWRRLLFGQPHLCFEYLITARRVDDPDLGARAGAARPGRTAPSPPRGPARPPAPTPPPPTPTPPRRRAGADGPRRRRAGPGWRTVTAGGVLRLARPGGLPIAEDIPG